MEVCSHEIVSRFEPWLGSKTCGSPQFVEDVFYALVDVSYGQTEPKSGKGTRSTPKTNEGGGSNGDDGL